MGKGNFYVYVLLNQKYCGEWSYKDLVFTNKPFYIGIGRGYRMTAHFTPFNLKKKSIKNNIIKTIMSELDELPIFYKIYCNLDEDTAKNIETDLIQFFGRIKDNSGILSNLTDGGDGISGYNHTEKYKNSLRKKLYQYDLSGNFIKEWESLKSVVDFFNLSGGGGIRASINKKNQCKGFLWQYIKAEKLEKHVGHKAKYYYGIIMEDNTKKFFKDVTEINSFFKRTVSIGNISSCASGKIKSYLGYKWVKEIINQGNFNF